MIIKENITLNGKDYIKTYSDNDFILQKQGTTEKYTEAIDTLPCEFEYVETEEKILEIKLGDIDFIEI